MIRIIPGKRQRRICCDNCHRVLGIMAIRFEDRLMDPIAGYVIGVGKRSGIMIHTPTGRVEVIEHPVACSDACEDRLLETWPRTTAEQVHAGDWEPEFRDADVLSGGRS